MKVYEYNEHCFKESDDIKETSLNDIPLSYVRYINAAIQDVQLVNKICETFNFHHLIKEDIFNTNLRPKIKYFDKYVFIAVKILYYDKKLSEFTTKHVSIVFGKNYIITFNESSNRIVKHILEQIQSNQGKIRKLNSDYFVYTLLDLIVDNYYFTLEELEEKIEETEDALITKPSKEILQEIHKLKRQMLFLHKAVWPLREVIGSLERDKIEYISDESLIYFRDLYDHIIQVMDITETLRDILSSMLDIYLSSTSNKMNEIMKVLTIISTIFIPLSFIVGLYGMNLSDMPEYRWPYMYPVLWIVMISIVIFMITYFKKKKWW